MVGPLRAPYLSTTSKIDDDETVDAEQGDPAQTPGCCGLADSRPFMTRHRPVMTAKLSSDSQLPQLEIIGE